MPDLVQFHEILVLIICASSKGSATQSLHTVDSEFFVRSLFSGIALHNIYILNVAALDETVITSCLHFLMQNIEHSRGLGRASRWSNVNVNQ